MRICGIIIELNSKHTQIPSPVLLLRSFAIRDRRTGPGVGGCVWVGGHAGVVRAGTLGANKRIAQQNVFPGPDPCSNTPPALVLHGCARCGVCGTTAALATTSGLTSGLLLCSSRS